MPWLKRNTVAEPPPPPPPRPPAPAFRWPARERPAAAGRTAAELSAQALARLQSGPLRSSVGRRGRRRIRTVDGAGRSSARRAPAVDRAKTPPLGTPAIGVGADAFHEEFDSLADSLLTNLRRDLDPDPLKPGSNGSG